MKAGLLKRRQQDIVGVLECLDRVVITGTLTDVAYPDALAAVSHGKGIHCFDFFGHSPNH